MELQQVEARGEGDLGHARRDLVHEEPDRGDESPAVCAEAARRAGLPWWRAHQVGGGASLLESLASYRDAEAALLDADSSAYGGSGESFDWSIVPEGYDRSIVLAGGLTPENVGAGIERLAPMAVDVSSGIQGDDPRTKDPARMARFVAAVMQADARRAAR